MPAEKAAQQLEPIKKDAFLKAYRECGNISEAAKTAGLDRTSHYYWMKHDPDYPARFASATDDAVDLLEKEARRRAYEGYEEPVFYKGVMVAKVLKYSDLLLMFLLKGARPDKYREYFTHEHTFENLAERMKKAREKVNGKKSNKPD